MISSLFSNLVWRACARQTRLEKREVGLGWCFTQGGGRGGLALGYYLAALIRAPEALFGALSEFRSANRRAALDAGRRRCFHVERPLPGPSNR
jgi:hypothetical protein